MNDFYRFFTRHPTLYLIFKIIFENRTAHDGQSDIIETYTNRIGTFIP